jgi:hypothetical protein
MSSWLCGPLILCAALPVGVAAQSWSTPPLWEGLDPGHHTVGFRSYWRRDWSRSWTPSVDPLGRPFPTPPARPVRMNVWYPARSLSGSSMTIADYLDPAHTPGFEVEERVVRETDVGAVDRGGFRRMIVPQALYDALLATPTAARQDATPAAGHFPVIVYALGQGDYTQEDIPFCEYLASHGYIVVSVPQLGTSPRRDVMFIHDPPSYDAQVSDLGFALANVLHDFAGADSSRIGAVGMSMGGVYATLLALRNSAVHVVIGRDPSIVAVGAPYAYRYWESPEFDGARFRGHMLILYRQDSTPRARIVDSLRFADRELIRLPNVTHTDFTGYPQYSRHLPPAAIDSFALAHRSPEAAARMYAATARYTACYLDAILARGEPTASGCGTIPGGEVERLPPAPGPTEEELYTEMHARGLESAVRMYRRTAPATPPDVNMRRTIMQRIANELGYASRPREEAAYLQLMTVVFPDADAFEHAGDTWAGVHEIATAREDYERALAIDPARKDVRDKIAALGTRRP